MKEIIKSIFKKKRCFIEPMSINWSASVGKRIYIYIVPVRVFSRKEAEMKIAELMKKIR